MQKAFIRELFLSIQGEGPHIGEEHLFIRFCGCNLSCKYCDTDFLKSKSEEYTPETLLEKINSYGQNLTLSLTGGEPLCSADFLEEFLPLARNCGHKIYLETNGTLPKQLEKVINLTDIVSADIKLESSTEQHIPQQTLDEFFSIASKKEVFAKIVFDNNITADEIINSIKPAQKYNFEIILQPKMNGNDFAVSTEDCEKIFSQY